MSISNETGTIVLNGESYPVQAFTLDQLQVALDHIREYDRISSTFDETTGKGGPFSPEAMKEAGLVVSLAIGKPTAEIRATVDELFQAVEVLKEVSGLIPLMKRVAILAMTAQAATGTASTPNS